MKQYRTLLLIVTFLFIGWTFLIVESCAQVKLTQVESDTILYRIPVAHRTIAGQPGKYFMKYMGLEPLMDSLDLKGTKIDSMTFASDTLKLYTNDGIFKVEILAGGGGSGTVTSVGLTTGTSGTDVNVIGSPITSSGSFTLNLPSASASNRGLLTSADHTLFSNKFTLPSLTSGSVLFSNGTTIAQDNPNFFWNDATNRLSIKSGSSPVAELDILGKIQIQNAAGSVYFGNLAGPASESGSLQNIGIGTLPLASNTSGSYNIGVGPFALYSNTSGGSNIAIGNSAMYGGSGASNSVAIGTQSLYSGGATETVAIGRRASYLNTGNFNTVIGTEALRTTSSGAQNVAIGYSSGYSNTGSNNVFIGFQSGFTETGSNKLYIENSTGVPLIGGDFSTNRVGINKAISSLSTTLHVGGDVTIDTRTGTGTSLTMYDATGKLCTATLGSGLTITSGTLNQDYGAFTVAATTGGSGLVGPLDGDPFLTFTAGSGMTITRSGTTGDNQTLTFASTGGTTNLSYSTKSGTDVTLESSTGSDVIFRDGVGTFVNRVSANVIKYDVDEIYGQLSNTAIIGSATIDGVYRSVDFTAEDESFASIINAKTASDEIEVLVSGTYEIHYSLSYLVPSSRDVRWRIYKNTADIGYIGELTTYFTAGYPSKTFNIDLTAGDDISLRYIGVNGVSGTIDINSPILKVKRIK